MATMFCSAVFTCKMRCPLVPMVLRPTEPSPAPRPEEVNNKGTMKEKQPDRLANSGTEHLIS